MSDPKLSGGLDSENKRILANEKKKEAQIGWPDLRAKKKQEISVYFVRRDVLFPAKHRPYHDTRSTIVAHSTR